MTINEDGVDGGGWVGGLSYVTTLSSLVEMFGCCFRDERSVKTFQLIDRLEI